MTVKDILGRDIPDGELVVCMAIGRHSSGMHIGIQQGASVRGLRGLYSPSNRYWVQNPTEEELKYKQQILDKIQKEQEAAREREQHRRSLKAIPYKDLVVGHLYKDDKDDTYLFLGMCETIIKESRYKSDYNKDTETITGYVYLSSWTYKSLFESKPGDLPFGFRGTDYEKTFGRKTRKKLVEDLGEYSVATLPVQLEFERNGRGARWSSDKWISVEIRNINEAVNATNE